MLKQTSLVGSLLFIFGCSSLLNHEQTHPISFADVQNLRMGHTHSSELETKFGKANEVIRENGSPVWIYKDVPSAGYERAKFYIDPITGIVTNTIWIPDDSSGFLNENELFAHVKEGKFVCKLSPPLRDHHYTPTDGSCYNPKAGISYIFLGGEDNRGIFAIAFSAPQNIPTPAQAPNKTKHK